MKKRSQVMVSRFGLLALAALLLCAFGTDTPQAQNRSRLPARNARLQPRPYVRPTGDTPPPPLREFRAAWVATVNNIDWPSKRGLPSAQQKAELIAILDRAAQLHLNAIVLQVRPACDALYDSKIEPWSEYLTGAMGRAPQPYYDPLAFAVEEAHKRGIELHAWFNPYRAHHPTGTSPIAANHVSKRIPGIVKSYGSHLWLDPSQKATQDYSLSVILDVVHRYDIDGVHIDDYFYPYKEKNSAGQNLDFPDEPSWNAYVTGGGKLNRADWRRDAVNQFVERIYKAIKAEKRHVKFGISPFGIWRPGNPPSIQGYDQFSELYADARKWFQNGWLDYCSPQLYWPIRQTPQSYPVLLKWWSEQNAEKRHLWPGNYTSRVGDGSRTAWEAEEVVEQVEVTRRQPGATGNVHFSMKTLLTNVRSLSDKLLAGVYAEQALVPASPWLDNEPPPKPEVRVLRGSNGSQMLHWKASKGEKVWLWVVQTRQGGAWYTRILPQNTTVLDLPFSTTPVEIVAVSAVDRCGNQSAVVTEKLPAHPAE